MSDPAFTNLFAYFLLPLKKTAFWAMDLYPLAFAASGHIKRAHPLYKLYHLLIKRSNPHVILCLGPNQARYIKIHLYPSCENSVIIPVGLKHEEPMLHEKPTWHNELYIYYGYIGNIGEAHDVDFLNDIISLLDPKKHRLVIRANGSKKHLIKSRDGVVINLKEMIPRESLKYIDVHLVSLMDDWTHICVPSKALTAIQSGSTVLFQGSLYSDIWRYIEKAGWRVECNSSIEDLASVIDVITPESIRMKKACTSEVFNVLKKQETEGFESFYEALKKLTHE